MNPFQFRLRRVVLNVVVYVATENVVLTKFDDLFSKVDADGGNEVRVERLVDVLDEAARLSDAGVAQDEELDDVIKVEGTHLFDLESTNGSKLL
jgi:hypothetical protein